MLAVFAYPVFDCIHVSLFNSSYYLRTCRLQLHAKDLPFRAALLNPPRSLG